MKRLLLTAAAVLILFALAAACGKKESGETGAQAPKAGAAGEVAWMEYTEGIKAARAANKPVMIDFYTDWCKYCKMLDDTTYKDPDVVGILNKDFVAIKVNAQGTKQVEEAGQTMTETELAVKYQVNSFPTIWFFDGSGKPIAPLSGYEEPEKFKTVLTYITSGSFAKGVDYQTYYNSLQK